MTEKEGKELIKGVLEDDGFTLTNLELKVVKVGSGIAFKLEQNFEKPVMQAIVNATEIKDYEELVKQLRKVSEMFAEQFVRTLDEFSPLSKSKERMN